MSKFQDYNGWELNFFDKANNFREYQWSFFRKHIKKKILEVGPGNCVFFEKYYRISEKIFLFEPSRKFRKKLVKKFRRIKKIKILSRYDNSKYDTIIYLDVLEHIKNDEKEVLNAYNKLKSNGFLIISVPAFQHLYTQYDKKIGHFKRYNKVDFKKMFFNLKIKKYKMTYFDSIGYFFILISKFLNISSKVNFKQSIMLWNFLIPLSKKLDFFLSKFIGKSLMVIIQKSNDKPS